MASFLKLLMTAILKKEIETNLFRQDDHHHLSQVA